MSRQRYIFYSALLLTGVNLLLRFIGTAFQIFISNRIGATGIGLLQLVMSVGSLAMIAGMAGIRTSAMYLTAEEIGRKNTRNIPWVLSGCFLYSIMCSGAVTLLLHAFSPWIAGHWIGDLRTAEALRLYAGFLPAACLCGIMTGYFTAANRIYTLAAVEVAEQFISMGITVCLLQNWAGADAIRACQSIIFGSCLGSVLTLCALSVLQHRSEHIPGPRIPVRTRLLNTAVPLAVADILKAGINTVENLMVPKRLQLNPSVANPLAAYGIVSGMVFPIIMFPACILFGLAELLIPELARCFSGGQQTRISYLLRRGLKVALLYGLTFGGLVYLLAEDLCVTFYGSKEAVFFLKLYALLIPMLYCDALVDAMTKGLGQQTACVRYNIITSAMDVALLYLLLPDFGMKGYYLSFTVSHAVNFLLSLKRLLKITGETLPCAIPALSVSAAVLALFLSGNFTGAAGKSISYIASLLSWLTIFQVLGKEDVYWLIGLCFPKKSRTAARQTETAPS